MKSRWKKIAAALVLVVLIIALACGAYVSDYYHADEQAHEALVSTEVVRVEEVGNTWVFMPESPVAGVMFYPGAKVEAIAYAPLMQELAEDGILCVLVEMPWNLAIMDMNAADGIAEQYPDITDWYIGGHSLGGAMAASYAAEHTDALDGLILLAAYSTADLTERGLRVFSAYGSEDDVLNADKYEADHENLPADTTELVIDGGCHAGFGDYGEQSGDGTPTITAEEQQRETADAIATWIQRH